MNDGCVVCKDYCEGAILLDLQTLCFYKNGSWGIGFNRPWSFFGSGKALGNDQNQPKLGFCFR